jgi:hypothetical protein
MRRRVTIWAICLVTLALVLVPKPADAIPVFARRYQTSCSTCHVMIPKLNSFGIAFRNNGYRIPPNDEKFVKIPDVPLGAPAWKKLWPDALWPGGIPGVGPVAFRIFNDVVVNPSNKSVKLDFAFPNEFEILVGGTAGSGISYFGELEITSGDKVDLARAFIQFDQLGGTTLANLTIGRFEVRSVPFSRFHRRMTPSDFLSSDFRSPSDGFHFRRPQAGVEFWGAKTCSQGKGGIEYAVGVVNGNGPFTDNNTAKDVYHRLSYKFGGFGVTGSTEETETLSQTDNWRDNSVKVGTFSHFGTGLFAGGEDKFWRVGGDVDVFIGDLNVSTVALRGRDKMTATGVTTDYTAASVEANYMIKPWAMAILRYDTVFRDTAQDIRRFVPAMAFAIRANIRVVADWEAFRETSFNGVKRLSGDSRARIRLDLLF